jgi:DNA-binding MarR family transcriptional regulator
VKTVGFPPVFLVFFVPKSKRKARKKPCPLTTNGATPIGSFLLCYRNKFKLIYLKTNRHLYIIVNMIKYNTALMVGKIRGAVNNLILSELNKQGVNGIAPSHGDILVCLYEKNGLSVKKLAEKIHRTQPTVTVLIDKLQRLGFVDRIKSKEDSRVTLINLTQKGIRLEPVFREISEKINTVIYSGLTNTEKEVLEHLLEKVLKRF